METEGVVTTAVELGFSVVFTTSFVATGVRISVAFLTLTLHL